MGFLKNMKDTVGQAQAAAQDAGQWQQTAGAPAGMDMSGAMASRGALESQAHEQNRILSMAMGSYGDGSSLACRIDPADQQKIAFGEKPFM
jgi:hypothetical protein